MMNDRSSRQIFNFEPSRATPTYHFKKEFDGELLNASFPNYNMTQSFHSKESRLFEDPCQVNYNSLKLVKNKSNFRKKENTLNRQQNLANNCDLTRSFSGRDRKLQSNLKHEHCLNWLQSKDSYEQEFKELDANIQLLMWKKKHMEVLQKQKTKDKQAGECQKVLDSSTTIASDSPPPLSDFFKPEMSSVSADDGFESAVDAFNNQVNLQHISYLESELRKKDMKILLYQQMMSKRQHLKDLQGKDLGFLTPQQSAFDAASFSAHHNTTLDTSFSQMRLSTGTNSPPPGHNNFSPNFKTSTPGAKAPVRPTSFRDSLFPAHTLHKSSLHPTPLDSPVPPSSSSGKNTSMEVLKLKSELLVKEQHLRKTRTALKEQAARYNELLSQHMKLLQNNERMLASPLRTGRPRSENGLCQKRNVIGELSEVLEQLHRIVKHKRVLAPEGRDSNSASSNRNSVDKDLSMLHYSIMQLRSRLQNDQLSSSEEDHTYY